MLRTILGNSFLVLLCELVWIYYIFSSDWRWVNHDYSKGRRFLRMHGTYKFYNSRHKAITYFSWLYILHCRCKNSSFWECVAERTKKKVFEIKNDFLENIKFLKIEKKNIELMIIVYCIESISRATCKHFWI